MAEQEGIKKEKVREETKNSETQQSSKKHERMEKKSEKSANVNGNAKVSEKEKKEKDKEKEVAKLKEMEVAIAVINDKYIRLAAEFDNYRRRTAKERLDLIASAGADVISGLLPVLDDCERALDVLKQSDANKAAIEGTELIYNKLKTFLESRGLTLIEAVGKPLDTDFHEAVAQIPVDDNDKKNKIVEVVQQGYLLNEKVIRFAKVVVGI